MGIEAVVVNLKTTPPVGVVLGVLLILTAIWHVIYHFSQELNKI